jgi:hypothetical protein
VDTAGKFLRDLSVAPLARDGSELLRMRNVRDPGVACRAFDLRMDRGFEKRLVRKQRDRLTRDLFLEVFVSMAAQALLAARLGLA